MTVLRSPIRQAIRSPLYNPLVGKYGGAFSPAILFAGGEQGVSYASSPDVLFTTFTGTTPVASPGDPAGLRLDNRLWGGKTLAQVLAAQPELVTNGGFDSDLSGWTLSGSTPPVWEAGAVRMVTNSVLKQTITTVAGRTYEITFNASGTGVTNSFLTVGTSDGGNQLLNLFIPSGGRAVFSATTTSSFLRFLSNSSSANYTIDNISIKEIPGNHAFQSTDASRPIYGRHPASGIRNLLTRTEEFDNAAWAKAGVTVTQSAGAEWLFTPTVTNNQKNVTQAITAGATAAISVEAKPSGYTKLVIQIATGVAVLFDLTAVSAVVTAGSGTASIVASGGGYYRCTAIPTAVTPGTRNVDFFVANASNATSFAGDGTSGILVRNPQAETSSTPTAYQRVGNQYDVTEVPFRDLHYLDYNGTNSFLVTGSIDFTGTDEVSIFAGLRKRSDAAAGALLELSSTGQNNTGGFGVLVPNAAGTVFEFGVRLTNLNRVRFTDSAAPQTGLYTVLANGANTAGTAASMRKNGASVGAAVDAGDTSGNFGNYPLYIGRRGGTTLPFNGLDYGMTIIGRLATDAEIAKMEAYLAARSGVAL